MVYIHSHTRTLLFRVFRSNYTVFFLSFFIHKNQSIVISGHIDKIIIHNKQLKSL